MDEIIILRKCLITDIEECIKQQDEQHPADQNLSLHQWAGLITEEFLEFTQAINETDPATKTDKAVQFGGLEKIHVEGVQTIALMVRMLAEVNLKRFENNKKSRDKALGPDPMEQLKKAIKTEFHKRYKSDNRPKI